MQKIHYAGELRIRSSRSFTRILAGWAACCSGDRAIAIRRDKLNTYDKTKVTCKACLRQIERERLGNLLQREEVK